MPSLFVDWSPIWDWRVVLMNAFFTVNFLAPNSVISICLFMSLCILKPWFLVGIPALAQLSSSGRSSRWSSGLVAFVVSIVVLIAAVTMSDWSTDNEGLLAVLTSLKSNARSSTMHGLIGANNVVLQIFRAVVMLPANASRFAGICFGDLTSGSLSNFSAQRHYAVDRWTAGPWWYLQAQMLPEYSAYFDALLNCIHLLCAALVLYSASSVDPQAGFQLTIFVVNYFRSDTTLFELWLVIAVLLRRSEVVSRMENLPWIAAGLLVPTLLIPLLTVLWVEQGLVNANFVFFQSFLLWVFLGLGCVEYVKALLRRDTGAKKAE